MVAPVPSVAESGDSEAVAEDAEDDELATPRSSTPAAAIPPPPPKRLLLLRRLESGKVFVSATFSKTDCGLDVRNAPKPRPPAPFPFAAFRSDSNIRPGTTVEGIMPLPTMEAAAPISNALAIELLCERVSSFLPLRASEGLVPSVPARLLGCWR